MFLNVDSKGFFGNEIQEWKYSSMYSEFAIRLILRSISKACFCVSWSNKFCVLEMSFNYYKTRERPTGNHNIMTWGKFVNGGSCKIMYVSHTPFHGGFCNYYNNFK